MKIEPEFNPELQIKISLNQIVAGGLHYGLDIPDMISILREVTDDYERKWNEIL